MSNEADANDFIGELRCSGEFVAPLTAEQVESIKNWMAGLGPLDWAEAVEIVQQGVDDRDVDTRCQDLTEFFKRREPVAVARYEVALCRFCGEPIHRALQLGAPWVHTTSVTESCKFLPGYRATPSTKLGKGEIR